MSHGGSIFTVEVCSCPGEPHIPLLSKSAMVRTLKNFVEDRRVFNLKQSENHMLLARCRSRGEVGGRSDEYHWRAVVTMLVATVDKHEVLFTRNGRHDLGVKPS